MSREEKTQCCYIFPLKKGEDESQRRKCEKNASKGKNFCSAHSKSKQARDDPSYDASNSEKPKREKTKQNKNVTEYVEIKGKCYTFEIPTKKSVQLITQVEHSKNEMAKNNLYVNNQIFLRTFEIDIDDSRVIRMNKIHNKSLQYAKLLKVISPFNNEIIYGDRYLKEDIESGYIQLVDGDVYNAKLKVMRQIGTIKLN